MKNLNIIIELNIRVPWDFMAVKSFIDGIEPLKAHQWVLPYIKSPLKKEDSITKIKGKIM